MWRMMTAASVETGSAGETLTQKGKSLTLSAKSSAPAVEIHYTTWPALRPSDWASRPSGWDNANEGYRIAGYTATIPQGTTVTFTTTLSKK
jgi:hypothetical protein